MQSKMGNKSSSLPPPPRTASNPDLAAYESACLDDSDLKSFDSSLQSRASHAINSISADLDLRSLSLDSLKELTLCFLDTNQQTVNIILKSMTDIWKDPDLFDLVNDYLQNSLHTMNFCASLNTCLDRARHSQTMIVSVLEKMEVEIRQTPAGREVYSQTLEELRKFSAAGDPFTREFFLLFQSVREQQELMLERIRVKKRKLDKKLGDVKVLKRVSNAIFVAVFASVLICSVVAAAVTAPPVVTALAAAAAVPMGAMGRWINSIWGKYEKELRAQRDIITSMQIPSLVVISDLQSLRVLVDKFQDLIEGMLHNADVVIRGDKSVVIAVEEIKKKVSEFVKTIKDLSDHSDNCHADIRMARALILRKIMNHPSSSSSSASGMFS